jgi:hypothetical protein
MATYLDLHHHSVTMLMLWVSRSILAAIIAILIGRIMPWRVRRHLWLYRDTAPKAPRREPIG